MHLHLLALLVFYIFPFLLHGLVENLQSMAVISFLAFSIMILLDRGSTWAVPYGSMVQHAIGKVGQRYITQPSGVLGPFSNALFYTADCRGLLFWIFIRRRSWEDDFVSLRSSWLHVYLHGGKAQKRKQRVGNSIGAHGVKRWAIIHNGRNKEKNRSMIIPMRLDCLWVWCRGI